MNQLSINQPHSKTTESIHMAESITEAATSAQIIINLDHGDSNKSLPANEMVQRNHYEHLRNQISFHLDTLAARAISPENYPTGSGWTQFLDGTRGAGKSTFLSSTKIALENDSRINTNMAFIEIIDPSRVERSEIILLVILQQLRKRVEEALRALRRPQDDQLREEWRRAFKGVAGGLSLFAKDYHPLDGLDPDLFLDWGLERMSDSASLRMKLHRLFATACSILGVRALMFAFDDADTDSSLAVPLLECIRKNLDVPIVMVLVTGDLELYSLLVRQHFAKTIVGKPEAALELQRSSMQGDRSSQYLRMIDHLEEQYLLKLFPIRRRMQLQPLWNIIVGGSCQVSSPAVWGVETIQVKDVIEAVVRRGLRVKTRSDVNTYVEFLLKQPLRSVLQVMVSCAPYLGKASSSDLSSTAWSRELTTELSRSLQALALTSLYKFSVDTDAIAARELQALTQAVFDLSILDGDIDTAPYLRPLSAEQDIRTCFAALAAEVPNFCAMRPGMALRYLLRGPGSVSLYSLARSYTSSKENSVDRLYQFKSYMGIGRKEDSLDWARRATAIIADPYGSNPKRPVVLLGIVGLNRKRPTGSDKIIARVVIKDIIKSDNQPLFPAFALSMIDVAGASGTRTYGSIFIIIGLIEKIISQEIITHGGVQDLLQKAYPPLTISAPNLTAFGESSEQEDAEKTDDSDAEKEATKLSALITEIISWHESTRSISTAICPSAVYLGKVWTRLFFSLEKAADEIRSDSNFIGAMEIFALCVINAILVEEAEHHIPSAGVQLPINSHIDKNNPRSSSATFFNKLKRMSPRRSDLPLTAVVATCPLLLGLIENKSDYASALTGLFPENTQSDAIERLMRQAFDPSLQNIAVAGHMSAKKQSSGGDSPTLGDRSEPASRKSARKSMPSDATLPRDSGESPTE